MATVLVTDEHKIELTKQQVSNSSCDLSMYVKYLIPVFDGVACAVTMHYTQSDREQIFLF